MLKQRIVTAVVLLAGFLSALYFLPLDWLMILAAAVVGLAGWEWSNMMGLRSKGLRFVYVVVTLAFVYGCYWWTFLQSGVPVERGQALLMAGAGWWCLALLLVFSYPRASSLWGSVAGKAVMGWLVLLPMWVAMALLMYQVNDGKVYLLLALSVVVLMDTGGYFAGRKFGRRKLMPAVSPGKTLEGFFGGLAVNVLVLIFVAWYKQVSTPELFNWAILILVTACASVLGDLLESMVKRHRQIKDSGHILPGHGGVLDRIDGVTSALPVFTLLMLLLQL